MNKHPYYSLWREPKTTPRFYCDNKFAAEHISDFFSGVTLTFPAKQFPLKAVRRQNRTLCSKANNRGSN